MIFSTKSTMTENKRNDFTIPYYNSIILSNDRNKNWLEVSKYNTTLPHEAEVIITYRNKTADIYNTIMMNHYNYKNIDSIGMKIICKSNNLRKLDIYNNFEYTIKDIKQDNIILNDDTIITIKQLKSFFKPAYCKTIYACQGKSLKSYYYAPEDKCFLNGKTAYTIISRIKNKN
jgi:hypothetical protein